jgi:formamidopyrimidine-DNA glycosylase
MHAALRTKRAPIKAVLLSQRPVSGIGNIYADEILHRSHVHPRRAANRLSAAKVGEICNQTVAVLTEAVALGGSTLVDTQYVGLDGSYGGYQDEHLAYGREDEPCLTCASVGREKLIKRIQVAGRSTFFCPFCQR